MKPLHQLRAMAKLLGVTVNVTRDYVGMQTPDGHRFCKNHKPVAFAHFSRRFRLDRQEAYAACIATLALGIEPGESVRSGGDQSAYVIKWDAEGPRI